MIAALAILGFVVDNGTVDFHFAGGKIALEVGHIIQGIPQTPFHKGEEFDGFVLLTGIGETYSLDFSLELQRDKKQNFRFQIITPAGDAGVGKSMTAFIKIQILFNRFPARRPDIAAIVDVKILAAVIQWHVVVTVAGDPAQTGVFKKAVAAGCVGDDGKKIVIAEEVNPGVGCPWGGYDVFSLLVIKITEFHGNSFV